MIVGIGTDITEISRIRKAMEQERFLQEYFGEQERGFLLKKKDPVPSVANNFAAKEAFSKALGTGVRGFRLCEVEVLRDALGKPYIELHGAAAACMQKRGGKTVHVSLSNSKENAVAFVVLEG